MGWDIYTHRLLVKFPLGDGGGTNHRWLGGTGTVVRGIVGIFLCWKWPCRVDLTREATEGVQCPH